MKNKLYGLLGFAAAIVFWTTYLIMSAIRPEYSMFTKAVSELGAVDAPNKWIWNSLGYIIPGTCIAVFALGLYGNMAIENSSKISLYGLMLSGLFMALSGIFPGNFDDRQSTTMVLHTVGSFASYFFFLIAAFTFPKLMDKSEYWKKAKIPTLIFTYLTIVFGAWVFVFSNIPAFGQRLVFFFYFLWIGYMAVKLYRYPKNG